MSLEIRALARGDIAEIAGIHATCFPDEAWDSSALATVLSMPGTGGRVASAEQGRICGFLVEQCLSEIAEILTLGVAPALRRQGIGRALLVDCMARLGAAGAERMVLEVAADNEAGIALYRSLGFVRQGTRTGYYRRAHGPHVDAWRLSLDIPPPQAVP
jgi:ribosomal-protein-alanine N-acetyltransferase